MKFSSSPSWSILGRPTCTQNHEPGPGLYSPKLCEKKTSCKFGSSKRPELKIQPTPGPGSYNTQESKAPGFYCSKEKKTCIQRSCSPGPGSYNTTASFSKAGGSIGKDSRSKLNIQDTPGPGSYEPPDLTRGPKYSLRNGRSSSVGRPYPGPGAYNINPDFSSSFVLGSAQRDTFFRHPPTPGPGKYSIPVPVQGPKWQFALSSKSSAKIQSSPGPGSYFLSGTLNKTAFSIKGRRASKVDDSGTPGPGTYDLSYHSNSAATFPKAKRESKQPVITPGPGDYSLNDQSSKSRIKNPIFTQKKLRSD